MSKEKKKLFTDKKFKVPAEYLETEELVNTSEKMQKKENKNAIGFSDVEIVKQHSENQTDLNKDVMDLFPDIALSIEIIVSSIIAPNDLVNTNLYYTMKDSKIPVDVTSLINTKIKSYIKEEYNIEDRLYTIIEESMFTVGSYAELILPSNIVNELYQSYTKLSRKQERTAGFEEIVDKLLKTTENTIIKKQNLLKGGMVITENINILHAEEEYGNSISSIVSDVYLNKRKNIDGELISGFEDETITEDILSIFDDGGNLEQPFVKKIDANCVVPIVNKDDVSKHYGYFIILDSSGKPVTDENNGYGQATTLMREMEESSMSSALTNAKNLLELKTGDAPMLNNIDDAREALIVKQLSNALSNTPFDGLGKIDVDGRDDLIDVMLHKVLNKQKINVLFVPENLLAYYAYKYRTNGTGESVLEKLTLLTSMRALTMFSDLTAFVKSSIPLTRVTATIDEDDTDYRRTMKKIISQVLKNRQLGLPIGMLKINDLTDWLVRAGFSFDFNHPGLPDTKVEISEDTVNIEATNPDLKEDLDKKIIRTIGLPPDIIDNAFSPDFATSIVSSNAMLARRINGYQTTYNKLLTSHVRKILKVDGELKREIMEIITPNLKHIRSHVKKGVIGTDKKREITNVTDDRLSEAVYLDICRRLTIQLPTAESEEDDKTEEAFNKFKDRLDGFMDIIISSEVLPEEIVGEIGDKMESVKAVLKSIIVKKWVNENGYMDEVMSMLSIGEDGKPIFNVLEEYKAHLNVLETTILPFLKEMTGLKEKMDDKIDKIDNPDDEETEEDITDVEEEEVEEETEEVEEEETEEVEEEEEIEEEETKEEPEEGSGEELE